jgi:putative polyketide hydroxylase
MLHDKEYAAHEHAALIAKAIGRNDVAVKNITNGVWELSVHITDWFTVGRIFLTGSTVHTLLPNCGRYGVNTGIEDVHNLAWKLQCVLEGKSTHELLDTYDAERRPIAWLRYNQIFACPDYKSYVGEGAVETPIIKDDTMELGQLY